MGVGVRKQAQGGSDLAEVEVALAAKAGHVGPIDDGVEGAVLGQPVLHMSGVSQLQVQLEMAHMDADSQASCLCSEGLSRYRYPI